MRKLNDGKGGNIHGAKKNFRAATGDVTGAYSPRNDGDIIGLDSGAVVVYTIASVNVTVATDKAGYTRRQNVRITTTVTVNGAPAPNVTLNLTMTKPNGGINNASAITAANGIAIYQYRIHNRDPLGNWQVQANSSVGGVNGSASKSFTVQ